MPPLCTGRFRISTAATRVECIQSADWHCNKTRNDPAERIVRSQIIFLFAAISVSRRGAQWCLMWHIMMVCSGHGGEWGGGTVTLQGCIRQRDAGARRLAAPDRALQEGLVWWPPLQAPRSAGTKASAQLKDVNWGAFVPRARGHAEWENWPLLEVRLCLNPLTVSASGTANRLSGQLWGGGRHKKKIKLKKDRKGSISTTIIISLAWKISFPTEI